MKSNIKTRIMLLSMMALLLIIGATYGSNKAKDAAQKEEMRINVEEERSEEQRKIRRELIEEAFGAIDETQNALAALEEDNTDKALKALEKVIGKLELILAREPALSLIPIDAGAETINTASDIDTVKKMKSEVKSLINKGNLPEARVLLNLLASEVRVKTVYLPIKTYPIAIKEAVRLIDDNKIDEAKQAISAVLATMVITERSIPIPVLNTQVLVKEASDIIKEEKDPSKLKKEKKDEALKMLEDARYQLRLGEELGYGKKSKEFAELQKDIDEIENNIRKDEKSAGLFSKLRSRLAIFKEDISKEEKSN